MARAASPTAAAARPTAAKVEVPQNGANGTPTEPSTGDAIKRRAANLYASGKKKSFEYASDRQCQVAALTGAGGAVCIGAPAAGLGLCAGGLIGGAIGILPALFTFGLSIPAGAVIGAGCGMVFTGATGATVGFAGGSAIGYGGYARRSEIGGFLKRVGTGVERAFIQVKTKVLTHACAAKSKVASTFKAVMSAFQEKSGRFLKSAKGKTHELVTDKEVQAATGCVVGGATVLGAGGAVAGGAIGAAVGLVPAIFTFGLSIPFFAVVGGGCGLAAGGTTGAVAGGGAYATYKRRAAIRSFVVSVADKARDTAKGVQGKIAGAK